MNLDLATNAMHPIMVNLISNQGNNNPTYFPQHDSHIVGQQASCSACHYDRHGVNNTELVRFNSGFVSPAASAGPSFTVLGDSHGGCISAAMARTINPSVTRAEINFRDEEKHCQS